MGWHPFHIFTVVVVILVIGIATILGQISSNPLHFLEERSPRDKKKEKLAIRLIAIILIVWVIAFYLSFDSL